eukprot:scaffold60773_cov44-Phaeocystis_antarctica.AAC.4
MFVTLEVSKLSGWLNADAPCRESKGGRAVRSEVYQSAGGRRRTTAAHAACRGGLDCRLGARHGAERTWNIWYMVVTPEVSQLEMSVLKLVLPRKSWLMSVITETSQPAMGPYVALAAVGSALKSRTAVTRAPLVVKVAGQVPGPQLEPYPAEAKAEVPAHAQRMSSLLVLDRECVSCRVARRAYAAGRGSGWERRGVAENKQRAGAGSTADWGQGGAHPEHGAHVRDAEGVEAQRLVERRRVLPRVERRAYGAGRGAGV